RVSSCGPSSTGHICGRRPARRPPPRCWGCRSAPTAATWPKPSTRRPSCCGRWRSAPPRISEWAPIEHPLTWRVSSPRAHPSRMAHILILGAGLAGLTTGTLLARDGHQVTVLERDPAEPPPPERADEAWREWQRRGVNQFRLPHFMLPRWWAQLRAELPDIQPSLEAAGARSLNVLEALPEERRGPLRPDDDRFDTVTARRPVLEAALARVAETAGVRIRRGVTVTGVTTVADAVPRVTGVLTADGRTVRADLAVDCGGRRSALPAWLRAAGIRPGAEQRADSGFVYY